MNARLLLAAVLVTTVLAACGKGETPPASSGDPTTTTAESESPTTEAPADEASSAVGVTGTDYAFAFDDGPTLTAGEIELTLTNDGAEEHQITVAQLKEGKTFDDLVAVGDDPSQLATVIDTFGGPNGAAPGESVTATVSLAAGEYLFMCFIPAPDGQPHAVKGMLAPVTVEGDADATPPTAERRVVLSDYEFGFGDDALLEAGDYEIRNDGPQVHEATIYAPAEGSTVEDVLEFFRDPNAESSGAPPPIVGRGGVAPMNAGQSNVTRLEPGEYVFICFVPDAADGLPHFAHGMIQVVSVE